MTRQTSLFDAIEPRLPTRSTDPETSRRAAAELPVRQRQLEVLIALRHAVVALTADQVRGELVAHGWHRERNECASRLSELQALGLVAKRGVRRNHRGRNVATWVLTRDGRLAARADR